ncbi:protein JINGUBANG-like [Olea europaea var. sylvestris]|uniref:Vegetative incompatibility HET-E-1-like n=1 Tax=Olea europaea subsp. europaea TaxID=158383 RepID=A0A8S0PTU6_OLEEU|nr:protein JINGUBANG-like [Olea europaea var. sylvestris]CAA2958203.1 vegetative incompatibility HET-E-1-like [Olea europaea subsp. europaea]
MGFLSCPLPCQSIKQDPYQLQHDQDHFRSDDSLSSNSSISSQLSLPSVPSLTPPVEKSPSATNHQCLATLKGHSSYVFSLALAGKHLFSGSSNSEIRLWDRDASSSSNQSLSRHNIVAKGYSTVKSIVVLGDKLFTAHQDHKIRVWKINDEPTPSHQESSTVYQTHLRCIATLPTVNDRCMKLFSAKNYVQVRRHKKCTWVHHVDTVSALALSRNGSLLYSVSWDRTFKVWRTSDFKCLESVWNAHDDAINAIVLSDEGYVYTGSADRKIKVWKKHEGNKKHSLVATLEKHKSAVNALAISTDGAVLYSGACDRSIIVWEKKDGGGGSDHMVVAGALRGHTKAILCLAVVSDLLCSGSADKTVRIWKGGIGKSYSCLAVFEGHRGPVKCLTASVDSKNAKDVTEYGTSYLIYSGSLDFDIKIWQIWVPNF